MTGRALVFSNPQVVELLKTAFVPYAGDKWYLSRQQDAEGRFFRSVAGQWRGADLPPNVVPQGLYVIAPDGALLGADHFRPSAERFLALLRSSLDKWKGLRAEGRVPRGDAPGLREEETPPQASALSPQTSLDAQYARRPPEGGLILDVFSRIPLPPPPGKTWTPNLATGRDHLWLTQEEWRALLPQEWKAGARYPVPRAVAARLARFHLVDNVRGEPTFWEAGDVRETDLHLVVEDAAAGRLRLEGTARMARGQEQGYDARVQGYLTVNRKQGRLTQCDLLAWGEAWGEGTYTRGAPPGKFPLLIAARIAGKGGADLVPPQGSRHLAGYFGAGR